MSNLDPNIKNKIRLKRKFTNCFLKVSKFFIKIRLICKKCMNCLTNKYLNWLFGIKNN